MIRFHLYSCVILFHIHPAANLLFPSFFLSFMNHPTYVHVVAFASASSAATIPVSTECVQSTGLVPESIIRFVIPLGATVVRTVVHYITCRLLRLLRHLREILYSNQCLISISHSFSLLPTSVPYTMMLPNKMTDYNSIRLDSTRLNDAVLEHGWCLYSNCM
jgi:hypothetical protein